MKSPSSQFNFENQQRGVMREGVFDNGTQPDIVKNLEDRAREQSKNL